MAVPVRADGVLKPAHDGHVADVVGDLFYNGIHKMRYRRCGETTTPAVEALKQAVYEGRGDTSVCGGTVKIELGYAYQALI